MKKLIFTLAVCLFALNGMAQKKDWAGFGRFAKENAQVEVRPDAVFMGNSITEGWAYQDPEFFKQNNFVGRGISGQTTAQMLCRFRPDVLAHNPKCVVVTSLTRIFSTTSSQWCSSHRLTTSRLSSALYLQHQYSAGVVTSSLVQQSWSSTSLSRLGLTRIRFTTSITTHHSLTRFWACQRSGLMTLAIQILSATAQ